jgi:hypothetical protein
MQVLGARASLRRHEQDILYTSSLCGAHKNDDIIIIGKELLVQHKLIKGLRADYEEAEDHLVITSAIAYARDVDREKTLVLMGKFADSLGAGDRSKLFRVQPSDIARLGQQAKEDEIQQTLMRLQHYPQDHPLRTAYEPRILEEQKAFKLAKDTDNTAELHLSSIRFKILNAKTENDAFRIKQYGRLITLTSKGEANTFFRSWRSSSGPDDNKGDTAPEPPSV